MTADGLSDPPAGRRRLAGTAAGLAIGAGAGGHTDPGRGLLFVTGNLVEFSSQENTVEILQEAVARDASGALVLRDTPRLRGLRAEQPDLWAVLRDGQGRELRDGPVPPEFAAIGGALDGVGQARLGWNLGDPPRGTARMRKVETEAGRVAVLTGPASSITARNALIGAGLVLWKMVLPIALMTLAATLLATHLAVRRTLGGLRGGRAGRSHRHRSSRDETAPGRRAGRSRRAGAGGQRRAGQAGRAMRATSASWPMPRMSCARRSPS